MLERTDVMFMGCRVWVEGENKRQLTKAAHDFSKWVVYYVGSPVKFSQPNSPNPVKFSQPNKV
jgi:hypothetical protein